MLDLFEQVFLLLIDDGTQMARLEGPAQTTSPARTKGALSVAESVAALNPTKNGFLLGQGHIHPRQDFTVTARTTSAAGRSLSITCRPRLDSTFAGRRSS